MVFREVSVIEVRQALRAWLAGKSERAVGAQAGVDRKTGKRYVTAAGTWPCAAGDARTRTRPPLAWRSARRSRSAVRPPAPRLQTGTRHTQRAPPRERPQPHASATSARTYGRAAFTVYLSPHSDETPYGRFVASRRLHAERRIRNTAANPCLTRPVPRHAERPHLYAQNFHPQHTHARAEQPGPRAPARPPP